MLATLAGISLSVRVWFCCDISSYIFMAAAVIPTSSIKTNIFFTVFFSPGRVHLHQWTRLKGALPKALLAGIACICPKGLCWDGYSWAAGSPNGTCVCVCVCMRGEWWSAEWIVKEKKKKKKRCNLLFWDLGLNKKKIWRKISMASWHVEVLSGCCDVGCLLASAEVATAFCCPKQTVVEQVPHWLTP